MRSNSPPSKKYFVASSSNSSVHRKLSPYFSSVSRKLSSLSQKNSPLIRPHFKLSKQPISHHSRGNSQTPDLVNSSSSSKKTNPKYIHKRFPTSISPKNSSNHPSKCSIPKYYTFDNIEPSSNNESLDVQVNQVYSNKIYNNFSPFTVIKNEISKKRYKTALSLLEKLNLNKSNSNILYLKAFCYMKLKNYDKAVENFDTCIKNSIKITENMYLNIYKSYIKTHKVEKADYFLDALLKDFPKSIKGNLIKGKSLFLSKKWEEASNFLEKSQGSKVFAMLMKCWKEIGDYDKAVKYLNLLKNTKMKPEGYWIEFAKIQYKFGKHYEALGCIDMVKKISEKCFEGEYYEGKCKAAIGNTEEAELILENICKECKDGKMFNRVIFKLSAIKFSKNDFYGAYSTLKRTNEQTLSTTKKIHSQLTEAAYSVVQANYFEAISLYTNLLSQPILEKHIHTCYIYRAFSYIFIKKFPEAISDYNLASSINKLDPASFYNNKICTSMILFNDKNYDLVIETLNPLELEDFSNPMWKILRIICILLSSENNSYDASQAITEIKNFNNVKNDSEIHLIIAICRFFDQKPELSLVSAEKAINYSDKPSILALTLSGFSNIALRNYCEAYDDLTKALKLNKNLKTLYSFRGICAFLAGNDKKSAKDLIRVSELNDKNAPLLSLYLLVVCHNPQEALKLANQFESTSEIEALKAHCYLIEEQIDECLECLGKLEGKTIENDIFIIEGIKAGKFETKGPGLIFNEKHELWHRAIKKIYSAKYEKAISIFEKLFDTTNKEKDLIFQQNPIMQLERLEILYNLAISNLLHNTKQSLQKASTLFSGILKIYESLDCPQIILLATITEILQGNKSKSEKYLISLASISSNLYTQFINKNSLTLSPFCTGSKLSIKFPPLPLLDFSYINIRPIMRLPSLQPPLDYFDCFDILLAMLKAEGIIIRPEVPWLQKINRNYVFTEKMVDDIESQRSTSTLYRSMERMYKSFQINKLDNEDN
ncbi:hypothetical protein SteCoe_12445 [Stentor coeruleus]|uniref:TPR-like protein n=1 Tax=Stentor coeruleus TaxID=5963 RepID=A0A1R2CAQ9_9CILI|nr:hypothetical protein SteCoe_12445 [Stentor coeruleus]